MSSGLRLRRPVFFAAGLRCPVCLRRIALCPVFLPVFRLSLAGPHFPLPAFPFARVSLCPCLPLSASPFCPCFSQSASPQLCRFVLSRLYSVWFFFCHFLFFRSSSIACRLLSVARCAVHRPALAACCPSPVVHPLPPVARNLPPAVYRPLFIARCVARTPSPLSVPRRRAAPLSAALRSGSRLLYPRNPGLRVCGSCLPCRSAAGSVGRSFRKNASALRTLVAAPFLTK